MLLLNRVDIIIPCPTTKQACSFIRGSQYFSSFLVCVRLSAHFMSAEVTKKESALSTMRFFIFIRITEFSMLFKERHLRHITENNVQRALLILVVLLTQAFPPFSSLLISSLVL